MGSSSSLLSFIGQCSHSLLGVVPLIPPYTPCYVGEASSYGIEPCLACSGPPDLISGHGEGLLVFSPPPHFPEGLCLGYAEPRGMLTDKGPQIGFKKINKNKRKTWEMNPLLCPLIFHLHTHQLYQSAPFPRRVVTEFLRS